jgi:6-phosphogluconolactonase (cycloisomerase 2 family)
MTLSNIGRITLALVVSVAMGLGMTSCGGGTIGFMWVLGTQSNQIGGFKIDNYTGNLTGTVGSPYSSNGINPVMLTLKSGGRFLYVLNAGDSTGTTGNFSLFSVGGDGTLSFQQSYTSIQGTFPVWIATDPGGNYLFVLSQRAPDYDGVTDFNGSITAYSLDPNTGRPSLITNAQVKNAQGTQLTFFEVGKTPIEMRANASCIYTLDAGDQTIFPYSLGSANGQLTQPTNSTIALGTANATSVNIGGSSYVYVTDAGSAGSAGSILPFTQGNNCALSTVTGGTVANLPTASYPIQTITTSDGKYVYVLNHSTASTSYANSSISGFLVESTGELEQLPLDTTTVNPFSVGAGPVCMAIDPTNQYLYTSNQSSSTITGKRLSTASGALQDLSRGSSFPTVGTPSCFVISPNTGS